MFFPSNDTFTDLSSLDITLFDATVDRAEKAAFN